MKWLALAAIAIAACGDDALPDGEALGPARDLVIVAHQGDDLLFVQPDVLAAVQAGRGVTTLYITAGDDDRGVDYAEARQLGVEAAYAGAVGLSLHDWRCGWIDVAGHPAEHCRLAAAALSLVFLGYPDGGPDGERAGSLLSLWEGTTGEATTVSRRPSSYTQDDLIAAVAAVVAATAPETVRTLEVASTHGREHSDHMIAGALALLGIARSGHAPHVVSYRGYSVDGEPATKSDALAAMQTAAVAAYDAQLGYAVSAQQATWIDRRYAVGFRNALRDVRIADAGGSGCIAIGEDSMSAIVDCGSAAAWTLADGELSTGGEAAAPSTCLNALPTGELVGGACGGTSRWFVDDEGHLWGSLVPVPSPDMAHAHLDCVAESGGRPRLVLCGGGSAVAPAWTFVRGAPVTSRLALPAASRLVIASGYLLFDDGATLTVELGDDDGSFEGPDAASTLVIAADSLAAGDGVTCGLAPSGATCVDGGVTPALVEGDDETDASFAIVGGEVCALTSARAIACAARGSAVADTLTTAIARDATAWIGDLDGDGRADWCVAGAAGTTCGLRGDPDAAGGAWSFSLGGVVDAPPAERGASALADVDFDGLLDLCGLDSRGIVCARGQGHGFGPTFVLAPLPPTAADAQLVLGNVDEDGHADACVAPGDGSITCELSP